MGYNALILKEPRLNTMAKKQTLRDVQKATTRRRLLDAAIEVYSREGYTEATVEKITNEAGASRHTFYLHFKDKEEVLQELTLEYAERAKAFMETFPGPLPSVEALEQWLFEAGAFLEREALLSSILTQVIGLESPAGSSYGLGALEAWIGGLAQKSPAFAAAIDAESQDVAAQAQARILAIQVVWAANNAFRNSEGEITRETVALTARSLHQFLHDPRFHNG